MALMESFGSNMLAFDEPGKNDLLGSLRPHFKEDFVFKRFLSEDNGTAPPWRPSSSTVRRKTSAIARPSTRP